VVSKVFGAALPHATANSGPAATAATSASVALPRLIEVPMRRFITFLRLTEEKL
jgi:hypothetical protein